MTTDLTRLARALKGEIAAGAAQIGAHSLSGGEAAGEPAIAIERARVALPIALRAAGLGAKSARLAVTLPGRPGPANGRLTLVFVAVDT